MSDSSRKLSARTARPASGDAIMDVIEVRGGEERTLARYRTPSSVFSLFNGENLDLVVAH
jgi:hypothetical protein